MTKSSHVPVYVLVAMFATVVPASGQSGTSQTADGPPVGRPAAFGTVDQSIFVFPAVGLIPFSSAMAYNSSGNRRFGDSGQHYAPVLLPTGSIVTSFEVEGCDSAPAGGFGAFLVRCSAADNCVEMASALTSVAGTPGCARVPASSIANAVIDNNAFHYYIVAITTFNDTTTSLVAFRVGSKRQVSPAPATATFADVPVGDPLHRFVEALVAAGITGGCGGGNYCPNAPLTRGQMAVFLSAALGLHWPN